MRYVHDDEAWAKKLAEEVDEYICACENSIDPEEGDTEAENFETISGQPFDGCGTCYGREYVMFLIPRIIDAYKAGILTEEDNG